MRQSFDQQILSIDNKFIGISLGSDHCAEHEWGIEYIQRFFGMYSKKESIGSDRFKTEIPVSSSHVLEFYEHDDYFGFFCLGSSPFRDRSDMKNWPADMKPHFRKDCDFYSAWSREDFCFFVKKHHGSKNKAQQRKDRAFNKEMKGNLKELFSALKSGNAAIWIGGAGPFHNGGLCFAILDRLPQDITDGWREKHLEEKKMDDYLKASGIHAKLEKAGKRFFYCRPSRSIDGKVRFWLNPCDQRNYNYGYYTLEDLRKWCDNKGPVVKKENAA